MISPSLQCNWPARLKFTNHPSPTTLSKTLPKFTIQCKIYVRATYSANVNHLVRRFTSRYASRFYIGGETDTGVADGECVCARASN